MTCTHNCNQGRTCTCDDSLHVCSQPDDTVPDVWEEIHRMLCAAVLVFTLGICVGIVLIKAGIAA